MSATIGSSDVAAILGLSPWRSPWDVRAKLLGLEQTEISSPALGRGHRLEPLIVEEFCRQRPEFALGVNAIRGPRYEEGPLVSSDWPLATCRPDLLLWDSPPELPVWPDAIMEAKHAMILDPREWGTRRDPRVPRHYETQALWQCYVCGVSRCWITVWGVMDDDWRIMEIDASQARIDEIVSRVRAWHTAMLEGGIDLDGSDACKRAVARFGLDGEREATETEALFVERLKNAREAIRQAEEVRNAAAHALSLCMSDAKILKRNGLTVAYRRNGSVICTR